MLHMMSRMGKLPLGQNSSSAGRPRYEEQESDEWLVEVVSTAGIRIVRAKMRDNQLYYFIGDHWLPVAIHL